MQAPPTVHVSIYQISASNITRTSFVKKKQTKTKQISLQIDKKSACGCVSASYYESSSFPLNVCSKKELHSKQSNTTIKIYHLISDPYSSSCYINYF